MQVSSISWPTKSTRDKKRRQVKANIVYNFGRVDRLDVTSIRRLVRSLRGFLSPEEMLQVQGEANGALRFLWNRSMGGAWVLRRLWERLGLHQVLNRALAPSSELATEEWVKEDVALGNDELIKVQHLYRVMDFLLEHEEAIQWEVFFATADLLNLEVDLLFFDTTTSYFVAR